MNASVLRRRSLFAAVKPELPGLEHELVCWRIRNWQQQTTPRSHQHSASSSTAESVALASPPPSVPSGCRRINRAMHSSSAMAPICSMFVNRQEPAIAALAALAAGVSAPIEANTASVIQPTDAFSHPLLITASTDNGPPTPTLPLPALAHPFKIPQ